MRLNYVGGPTLLLDFGGMSYLTDPTFDPAGGDYWTGHVTLSKVAGPALTVESLDKIDLVLLSHDHHFDNLDTSGRELLKKAEVVLTTPVGAGRLGGNAIGMAPWEERDGIVATPARHGPEGGDRGPCVGFILQSEGEPTVYVSGDTVWYEGVEEIIQRFPDIKIAILFLGAARISVLPSHLTFTAEEAVQFAQAAPDAVIVPVHYEGWKHFSEGRAEITAAFSKAGLVHRLLWLPPGEWVDPASF